jgi:hypothetical protein
MEIVATICDRILKVTHPIPFDWHDVNYSEYARLNASSLCKHQELTAMNYASLYSIAGKSTKNSTEMKQKCSAQQMAWYATAALEGNLDAVVTLGKIFRKQNNYAEYENIIQAAADLNSSDAQIMLGLREDYC